MKSFLKSVKRFKTLTNTTRSLNIRRVILITENDLKHHEYVKNFNLYGVAVECINPKTIKQEDYLKLLQQEKVISLLKDSTYLYKRNTKVKAQVEHLELVDNHCDLEVHSLDENGEIKKISYEHTTPGFLDLDKKRPTFLGIFGWDDIFTVQHTGKTYLEMAEMGGKISARDMVISKYIKDRFYYKKRLDLNFQPQQLDSSVDFSKSVLNYFETNPLFSNKYAKDFKLFNMFTEVCNRGVVFKSSKNRREKNYFSTVVNPAIPLVAKRDPVHEATFMAHDIGHFYILEPLYTGYENTEIQKLVYITYRMISEATTMVLADVLFVESIKRSGVEYDYSARKIHPLYSSSKLDIEKDGIIKVMKTLMDANVNFCCKGDETLWRSLVPEDVFLRFKDKFEPFFIEDYRWNVENYENMTKRSKILRNWWDSIKHLRKITNDVNMFSIDDFIMMMSNNNKIERANDFTKERLVDMVWKTMWEEVILPMFELPKIEPYPQERQLYNSFLRYMIGQFALFSEHEQVSETKLYRKMLTQLLYEKSHNHSITLKGIQNATDFFASYVDTLQQKNMISIDDCHTFKEIYPLFEPCYVFYDENKDYYPSLSDIYKKTFNFQEK